jgi:gliding motility-associated-like protein
MKALIIISLMVLSGFGTASGQKKIDSTKYNVHRDYVFTPGPGKTFKLQLDNVSGFQMKINTRWGQLAFTSNDINIGWEGYIDGKLAPEGVYYYMITFEKIENNVLKKHQFSGSLTLIHK